MTSLDFEQAPSTSGTTSLEVDSERNIKAANDELHQVTNNPHLPGVGHHMCFEGRSNSGKSRAAKELIDHYYKDLFDEIVVISPNAHKDNWAAVGVQTKNLITDATEDAFLAVSRRAQQNFSYHPAKGKDNYFTLIILDDIAEGLKRWRSFPSELVRIRHDGCSVWTLIQDTKFAPASVRGQQYAQSLNPQFTELDDLRRLADGKGFVVKRSIHTPDDVITLTEAIAEVRELNKKNKNKYGKLFVSTVDDAEPKFLYHVGADFTPLTGKYRDLGPVRGRKTRKIMYLGEDDDDS